MEDKWIQDLNLLTTYGSLGFYSYAKVNQIVLIDTETNQAWNYLTNIHFSSDIKSEETAKFITKGLIAKNQQEI